MEEPGAERSPSQAVLWTRCPKQEKASAGFTSSVSTAGNILKAPVLRMMVVMMMMAMADVFAQ